MHGSSAEQARLSKNFWLARGMEMPGLAHSVRAGMLALHQRSFKRRALHESLAVREAASEYDDSRYFDPQDELFASPSKPVHVLELPFSRTVESDTEYWMAQLRCPQVFMHGTFIPEYGMPLELLDANYAHSPLYLLHARKQPWLAYKVKPRDPGLMEISSDENMAARLLAIDNNYSLAEAQACQLGRPTMSGYRPNTGQGGTCQRLTEGMAVGFDMPQTLYGLLGVLHRALQTG